MSSELFTVRQIADKLQIHVISTYRLIRSGTLKAMRIPGVGLRIEGKELERLLSQNTKGTTTKPKRATRAKSRK